MDHSRPRPRIASSEAPNKKKSGTTSTELDGPRSLAQILWHDSCEGSEGGELSSSPSSPSSAALMPKLEQRKWRRDRRAWAMRLRPALLGLGMSGMGLGRVWHSLATEHELAALIREVEEKPVKNAAGYLITCLQEAGLMNSRSARRG